MEASLHGHAEVVTLLLTNGADVSCHDNVRNESREVYALCIPFDYCTMHICHSARVFSKIVYVRLCLVLLLWKPCL
jgi:hypothetical protein